MSVKTDEELSTAAQTIKNETTRKANTASRVGQLFQDLIDSKTNGANDNWRGAYDLSVNEYPSSGGTDEDGIPAPGNEWYVSVQGDVEVTGLGVVTLYYGALLKYLGGAVGTASSWKVTQ